MGATRGPSRARRACRAHRDDLLALAVLVALAVAFLSPSLLDGPGFGGFSDLNTSLTALANGLHGVVHTQSNGDAVSQMVTWNALDWRLVHSGHFPLWNDYSVLGMPQFLNFESSVLSLPDLLSYAVPLRFAFLVVVFVKLLLAGGGTYLACRVLGLRPVAALFGSASYMLSGAFVNWVTWPLSDVFAWSGFILAFLVLAYRSPRWRYVVLLALSVAFSILGGFPEANVMMVLGFGVLGLGAGITGLLLRGRLSVGGALRGLGGSVLGVLLASPLWLPGLQVIALSHRTHDTKYVGLPTKTFAMLFTQGFYGLPTGPPGTAGFGLKSWNYYETASYVGVLCVVLALVAVICCWRRPLVVGLFVALLVSFAATFEPVGFHPFFSLIDHLSSLAPIRFERIRTLSGFLLALLGALGLEQLLARAPAILLRRALWASALAVSGLVAYLSVDSFGPGYVDALRAQVYPALSPTVIATLHHQRLSSLVWPIVLCAVALGIALCWGRLQASPRLVLGAVGALLAGQVAYLFFAGVGIPSYSHVVYPATPALDRLQSLVGNRLVGMDNGNTTSVRAFGSAKVVPAGLYPNLNLAYSLRLFGVHDPLTPAAYYTSWPVAGAAPVNHGVGLYVPAITSASLARRYGVAFILAPKTVPAPSGVSYLATLAPSSPDPEVLYRVPGAARFSFASGAGRVSQVRDNNDGAFSMTTDAPRRSMVVLKVTALPGWHAALDGRPLALHTYDQVMESAVVPPGRHHLTLTYWPRRLSLGLAASLLALVALALGGLVPGARARWRGRGVRGAGGDPAGLAPGASIGD
jgi:hypothetical protein